MRWDRAKTYTEEDILRMQQEAVNRVQEFQARAASAAPAVYDVPEKDIRLIEPADVPPLTVAVHRDDTEESATTAVSAPVSGTVSSSSSSSKEQSSAGQTAAMPTLAKESSSRHTAAQNGAMMTSAAVNGTTNQAAAANPLAGLLGNFQLNSETLLILAMMLLLYNEDADNTLLMALGYLLL